MSFVRSSVSKRLAYCFKLMAVIFLLSKIIPIYSCYAEKGLVYIIIIAFFNRQLFFYIKYIKLNIYSCYNIRLVSNTKCIFLIYLYTL